MGKKANTKKKKQPITFPITINRKTFPNEPSSVLNEQEITFDNSDYVFKSFNEDD